MQGLWDHVHHRRSSKVAVLKLPPTTLLFQVNGAGLKELRSEWNSACKKAGVPVGCKEGGFTFHNTQHSCLTNLAAEGTPDTVARSISGHSTASMHERYQITQESAKKAALTAMTAQVRSTPAGLDEWRKDTMSWTPGGDDDLLPLVDPRKASGYKHFLALAGVAQLARACACQGAERRSIAA